MDLLFWYALFLAKAITIVVAIAAVAIILVNVTQRKRGQAGQLQITQLNERYRDMKNRMLLAALPPYEQKQRHKAEKKKQKQEAKAAKQRAKQGLPSEETRPTLYVLDFKGSMDAGEVTSLREEISAIAAVAREQDEVLLRLESPGGVVHGYGLAASQLQRLREKGIRLTVAVDKVAASGGYMMACVADQIIAAPFAIIGSIGVVAQVPNFNRLLKRNDIDVELHTAGEYKRTLTLFGENTEQGRDKFREDLNETHLLFKQFVQQMRPVLDIDRVATGEHWYGSQALEKNLIDALGTSDDIIIDRMAHFSVVSVRYTRPKKLMDRFTQSAADSAARQLMKLWQRGDKPLL